MAILGLVTIRGKRHLEIDADPTINATPAPVGSLAMFDDAGTGKVYKKSGPNDTDWVEGFSPVNTDNFWQLGGNTLSQAESMGSASNHDVSFLRDGVAAMTLQESFDGAGTRAIGFDFGSVNSLTGSFNAFSFSGITEFSFWIDTKDSANGNPLAMYGGGVEGGDGFTAGYFFATGGRIEGTATNGKGGNLGLSGGDVRNGGQGEAGDAIIRAGNIRDNASNSSGRSGDMNLSSGDIANTSVSANTGETMIKTGDHAGLGGTGALRIKTGDVSDPAASTGNIFISTTAPTGTGNRGLLDIDVQQVTIRSQMSMDTNKIVDVVDPVDPQDAATKKYVDDNIPNVVAPIFETVTTSNDTPTLLRAESLAEDEVKTVKVVINAWDLTNGDTASFERTVHMKRLTAGNVQLINTQTDYTSREDASWDIELAEDVGNQAINFNVVGDATNQTTFDASFVIYDNSIQ